MLIVLIKKLALIASFFVSTSGKLPFRIRPIGARLHYAFSAENTSPSILIGHPINSYSAASKYAQRLDILVFIHSPIPHTLYSNTAIFITTPFTQN
ncbi:hypothetical protein VCHA27O13_30147 [Vibrio chagasii]|nr:hypothetical protein VCHA27O13_30147 [Vibrio chagasii]CAH6964548.1 hypothetical protein VCHA34P115_40267 [Vibrio chagasii]CAH6967990.1 hypothetical protein VCHA36O157_40264 [Vibrio chagasii]CAH7408647.1 hypothetical protein VCHA37P191_80029 [Vibrio chagasii]CAH7443053.1 hypothetical protein VCHA53O466_60235 [Vibrio chagasii]